MLSPFLKNLIKTTYFYDDTEIASIDSLMEYVFPIYQFVESLKQRHDQKTVYLCSQHLEKHFPLYKNSKYTKRDSGSTIVLELTGTKTKKYLGVEFVVSLHELCVYGIKEHELFEEVKEKLYATSIGN